MLVSVGSLERCFKKGFRWAALRCDHCNHPSLKQLRQLEDAWCSPFLARSASEEEGRSLLIPYVEQYTADVRSLALSGLSRLCRHGDDDVIFKILVKKLAEDGGHPIHGSQSTKRTRHLVRATALRELLRLCAEGGELRGKLAECLDAIAHLHGRYARWGISDLVLRNSLLPSYRSLFPTPGHMKDVVRLKQFERMLRWDLQLCFKKTSKSKPGKDERRSEILKNCLSSWTFLVAAEASYFEKLWRTCFSTQLGKHSWPTPAALDSFVACLKQLLLCHVPDGKKLVSGLTSDATKQWSERFVAAELQDALTNAGASVDNDNPWRKNRRLRLKALKKQARGG